MDWNRRTFSIPLKSFLYTYIGMYHGDLQAVTQMRGTPGYLAPEWLVLSAVTDKSDIYSYGMVLLEILSGRRNLNLEEAELDKQYFPKWASKKLEEGNSVEEIVDPRLLPLETFDRNQADRMLRVAFICIQVQQSPTLVFSCWPLSALGASVPHSSFISQSFLPLLGDHEISGEWWQLVTAMDDEADDVVVCEQNTQGRQHFDMLWSSR